MSINYRGLTIPFVRMGAVTSDDLFGPNEQVLFDFYEANAGRYRAALDIGANIGVHSILMARRGWAVVALEPDPVHFDMLVRNILAHDSRVYMRRAAVSDRTGRAEFVRVLGNTTASHIGGSREFHGEVDRYPVQLEDCRELFRWADFAKIDCEGHEATLILATDAGTWFHMDAMLEVGNVANAVAIYEHLCALQVPMWAQKIGWRRVTSPDHVPRHHSEGSLFIGRRPPFPLLGDMIG